MTATTQTTVDESAVGADTADTDTAAGLGPGARLRAARLAQHRSQQEVARVLTLSVAAVEALEHDQYHLLPGNAQASHYLLSYAQLVQIEGDSIREATEALLIRRTPSFPQRFDVDFSGHLNAGTRLLALALLALALAGLVAWWYQYENRRQRDFMDELAGATHIQAPAPCNDC